jgi:hypothetical protein
MFSFSKTYIFICITILFSSCAAFYVPNVVNAPLLSEKGEGIAQLNAGFNGYDLQAAYAPINHLGVMVNSSFGYSESVSKKDFHRHALIEGGLGFFTKIGDSNWHYELYGGGGIGHSTGLSTGTFISYQEDFVDGDVLKYFAQSSLGRKGDHFIFAMTLKAVNFQGFNVKTSQNFYHTPKYVANNFIEGALSFKAGGKKLKANSQIGLSLPITTNNNLKWRPFIMNFGVSYQFNFPKKFDIETFN